MNDMVERARLFAIQAHKRIDHTRKYNKQSYDVHLKAVADLVASVSDDPAMIAAAWLHDTVEDTPATFEDVEAQFGAEVARLVLELTDVSKPGDGNRATRKAIDRAHTASASPRAKTVKLADLVDNCADICRHDARFAKVYLAEMKSLMSVLKEGDERVYSRAEREMTRCARRLGLESAPATLIYGEEVTPIVAGRAHQRGLRLFVEAFTAKDIAEPLRSFDTEADARRVAQALLEAGLSMAGVREVGIVSGFVRAESLSEGRCGEHARAFAPGQVLSADASLSDVIHVLTRYQSCFLTVLGGIDGVITRADIQKPVARMWLFGMVTMVEMELAARIRSGWADGSWHRLLSSGRLRKAEELMEERRRRGQPCDLVDCLQFSDKAQILTRDPAQLAEFGFVSLSAARQVIKELESLRNNLAHAQDIVTHDWAQIARLTRRIEAAVTGTDGAG